MRQRRVQDDTMLKTPARQFDIDSDLACWDVSGESRRPADDSERTHILVAVDLTACDPDDYFVTIETVLQINADSRHFPAHPPGTFVPQGHIPWNPAQGA